MILDDSFEQCGGVLPHNRRTGEDVIAGDRIAFLRHGAAGAASVGERLGYFADFGLHHEFYIGGDLAESAGDESEKATNFREAIASGVPGDDRLAELQLAHQAFLDFEALLTKRRECRLLRQIHRRAGAGAIPQGEHDGVQRRRE